MYVFFFLLTFVFILADILSKLAAVRFLQPIETYPIIKNVFHLTYCRNTGAAFSIFSGSTKLLAFVSALMIVLILVYIMYKKPQGRLLLLSFSMIIAGGIGNVIDRILRGYVVDFFDFRLINFAIFNVADIFVCVGVALLAVYIFKNDFKNESREENDI